MVWGILTGREALFLKSTGHSHSTTNQMDKRIEQVAKRTKHADAEERVWLVAKTCSIPAGTVVSISSKGKHFHQIPAPAQCKNAEKFPATVPQEVTVDEAISKKKAACSFCWLDPKEAETAEATTEEEKKPSRAWSEDMKKVEEAVRAATAPAPAPTPTSDE